MNLFAKKKELRIACAQKQGHMLIVFCAVLVSFTFAQSAQAQVFTTPVQGFADDAVFRYHAEFEAEVDYYINAWILKDMVEQADDMVYVFTLSEPQITSSKKPNGRYRAVASGTLAVSITPKDLDDWTVGPVIVDPWK